MTYQEIPVGWAGPDDIPAGWDEDENGALWDRLNAAEAIVRALAACPEPIDASYCCCLLCGSVDYSTDRDTYTPGNGPNHLPTCPWTMARALVAQLYPPTETEPAS